MCLVSTHFWIYWLGNRALLFKWTLPVLFVYPLFIISESPLVVVHRLWLASFVRWHVEFNALIIFLLYAYSRRISSYACTVFSKEGHTLVAPSCMLEARPQTFDFTDWKVKLRLSQLLFGKIPWKYSILLKWWCIVNIFLFLSKVTSVLRWSLNIFQR